jgi:hypothetical protein
LKADDAAMKQARLDDALQAASGKTRADLKCDDAVRLWLDKLSDCRSSRVA